MKKIIAVNAGPRTGWNTDKIIKSMAKGASDAGYEVEYVNLFKLDKYTGCVSCFGCKQEKTYGKCVCRDGLSEVLDKIRNADGLIIGSPNYLGNLTASFRALYERLVFQVLTYNKEKPCCNNHLIPVVLIMTSNCSEEMYSAIGYDTMLEQYKNTLNTFVGPTKVFVCGDTLQVNDYSKFDWTIFDPESKIRRHDETFEDYLNKAYELGKMMADKVEKEKVDTNDQVTEESDVLKAVGLYSKALTLLDQYDHQSLEKPEGRDPIYKITYDECKKMISYMEGSFKSDVFGVEKENGKVEGILAAVYQDVFGGDVYPSLEEKAANLLYFMIKDHPYADGCKRIAASLFLEFLAHNNALLKGGNKVISDSALVALTLMIAESKPEEKDIMVKLVMNFLTI